MKVEKLSKLIEKGWKCFRHDKITQECPDCEQYKKEVDEALEELSQ